MYIRYFIMLLFFVLIGCSSVKQIPVDTETAHTYTRTPWVVDKATNEVLHENVISAYYFKHTGMIQFTYEGDDTVYDVTYPYEEVTLMTTEGPCIIDDKQFICPNSGQ